MNFKQNLDIVDPITFETTKQPLKPFMVTQLQIAFEREQMILSPFDEVLHKQLIDYAVDKIGANGQPVFTSENEHFVDALGLAYLAMVLEFKELTNMIKDVETSTKVEFSKKTLGSAGLNSIFADIERSSYSKEPIMPSYDPTERRGDRPTQFKVSANYRRSYGTTSWGSRSNGTRRGGGGYGRAMW